MLVPDNAREQLLLVVEFLNKIGAEFVLDRFDFVPALGEFAEGCRTIHGVPLLFFLAQLEFDRHLVVNVVCLVLKIKLPALVLLCSCLNFFCANEDSISALQLHVDFGRMVARMADSINRALIIRFSSVGDIVLSSLLVRAFRFRFPDAQIDFVVKQEYADLVHFNPNITNVREFPSAGTFKDLVHLRKKIQHNNYDLVVDIHDSLRSRFLCLGAKRAVRINKRKLARFLLVRFKLNVYDKFGGAPGVAVVGGGVAIFHGSKR